MTKTAPKPRLTDRLMAEVIWYGPVAVTRADAHALALASTGDKRCADRFAFAPAAIEVPAGCAPYSYADAAALLGVGA